MASTKTLTDLDVDTIKSDLRSFMQRQTKFKDYDFEGSNMSIMLDLLSYNTFKNNFMGNMLFSEMFIDSAQLKTSMFSHCKELNYLPMSARSAKAKLRVTLVDVPNYLTFVTIPPNTRFNGNKNGKSVSFYNEGAVTVPNRGGIFYAEVDVYEGFYNNERYIVRAEDHLKNYAISNSMVDIRSIDVKVYMDNRSDVSEIYSMKTTLFELVPEDRIFIIEPNHDANYRIVFGKDIVGREPKVGEAIDIRYRICSGEGGNNVELFTLASGVSGYRAIVETLEGSVGGTEPESIESIRINAPRAIQVQNRAVTAEDYRMLLMREFPEIEAVSVYGGEDEDIPLYGRVIVIVDVQGSQGASDLQISEYERFLVRHCPITVKPMVRSAKFMYPVVSATIYYSPSKTEMREADVMLMARETILKYSDEQLKGFGVPVRVSKLTTMLDKMDASVMSSDVEVKMSVDMEWFPGVPVDDVVDFKQTLATDSVMAADVIAGRYNPAVVTSSFFYQGNSVFIQDDGRGVLSIYSLSPQNRFVVVEPNVGTVDYATGKVIISGFTTQGSATGRPVQLVTRTSAVDITPPLDRITEIRERDITINIVDEAV